LKYHSQSIKRSGGRYNNMKKKENGVKPLQAPQISLYSIIDCCLFQEQLMSD
jgi:hypothetical protein